MKVSDEPGGLPAPYRPAIEGVPAIEHVFVGERNRHGSYYLYHRPVAWASAGVGAEMVEYDMEHY